MLYEDCIEFFAKSWTQTHVVECESGFGSPHITVQGDCECIPVTCALWIDQQLMSDSHRNRSRGLFEVDGDTTVLSHLRKATKRILMDIHMPAEIYNRVLDTLNRQRGTLRSVTFSASYSKKERSALNTNQQWFEVLKFEVSEAIAES